MTRLLTRMPLVNVLFAHVLGRRLPAARPLGPRPTMGGPSWLHSGSRGPLAHPGSLLRPFVTLPTPSEPLRKNATVRAEAPWPRPQRLAYPRPGDVAANQSPQFHPSLERLFDLEELHLAYALQLSFDDMAKAQKAPSVAPAPHRDSSLIDPADELRWLARRSLGLDAQFDGPRLPFAVV